MYVFDSDSDLKSFISKNLISTAEATELLGCSRQYINQLVSEEKLIPVKKINKITLFFLSDIKKVKENR